MILAADAMGLFPGARSQFSSPLLPSQHVPKHWGTTGNVLPATTIFSDLNATFVTDGILSYDLLFITYSIDQFTVAAIVLEVLDQTHLDLDYYSAGGLSDCVYKVGFGPSHTFNSLVKILSDRAISPYTIHFSRCWVDAPLSDFNSDESGDVYII
jgi:hypothetical protein